MDFATMAENIGLDEDEFLELVELFVETCASDLNKLESGLQQENVQEVVQAAHSIKGASGNLGFIEISEIANGVERNGRENSLDGVSEAVGNMREKVDQLARIINKKNGNR